MYVPVKMAVRIFAEVISPVSLSKPWTFGSLINYFYGSKMVSRAISTSPFNKLYLRKYSSILVAWLVTPMAMITEMHRHYLKMIWVVLDSLICSKDSDMMMTLTSGYFNSVWFIVIYDMMTRVFISLSNLTIPSPHRNETFVFVM